MTKTTALFQCQLQEERTQRSASVFKEVYCWRLRRFNSGLNAARLQRLRNAVRCEVSRNASVPPCRVVDSAPVRLPKRRQASSDAPRMYWWRKPASKLSPAPIESTACVGKGEDTTSASPRFATAPFSPRF